MTNNEKKALKAKAHRLKPVVTTGQAGLTANVLAEIDVALYHHELIKVRLRSQDREQRKWQATQICKDTNAELIQSIGQISVLYRKNPDKR